MHTGMGGPLRMGPTSVFVIVTVILAAIGSLLLLVRLRHWALKIVSGALALSLGVLLGLIAVNDNFAYYRNWSAVVTACSGAHRRSVAATRNRADAGVLGRRRKRYRSRLRQRETFRRSSQRPGTHQLRQR